MQRAEEVALRCPSVLVILHIIMTFIGTRYALRGQRSHDSLVYTITQDKKASLDKHLFTFNNDSHWYRLCIVTVYLDMERLYVICCFVMFTLQCA